MDEILADMLPVWLQKYNELSGENIKVEQIKEWELRKFLKEPKLLDKVLESSGFFRDIPIISGAQEYFQKLLDNKDLDITIVTQPPRKADWAVRDKRWWIFQYFPTFDLCNVIFTHKKHLIRGDLLFDDRTQNLNDWKAANPYGITATILYPFNKDTKADWRFKKEKAWESLYNSIINYNNGE